MSFFQKISMRELKYHICDVFTTRPLQGNQLAVFTDAATLTDTEMQAIAREMNLSETTFILRRDKQTEQSQGVRVRIFTVQEELLFAGHPTLGTAATIRRSLHEYADAEKIVLDLKAGQIMVTFPAERNAAGYCTYGEMQQHDPSFGATHDAATIAPLLGLRVEDIADTLPQTVSTGMPFCIVSLRSTEALARLHVNMEASQTYLLKSDAKFFYVLAPVDDDTWRARMQFYNGEDPATGSAAGCAIAYLVSHGLRPSEKQMHLQQGIEIGRPSDLFLSAKSLNGKIGEVRVGGSTVSVANGLLFLE
jgi:trans-2,3-dihydro-3-hydroxyanthranilate isomerase